MKFIFVILMVSLSFGCTANKYNDEKMYDLASELKDLSQTIDGYLKFGDIEFKDGVELLDLVSKEYPSKVDDFVGYDIKVDIQADNAVLLLCDGDIALIEDVGCSAVVDQILWKNIQRNSCEFKIDANKVCN